VTASELSLVVSCLALQLLTAAIHLHAAALTADQRHSLLVHRRYAQLLYSTRAFFTIQINGDDTITRKQQKMTEALHRRNVRVIIEGVRHEQRD